MAPYIARRLVQILFTFFLIITLAFFLVQAQPGSYWAALTGTDGVLILITVMPVRKSVM